MQKTENYQLNQWDKSDRIQMEDFNADNAKVEQTLTEQASTLAEHAATLEKCGNCKIVYGSYTGNGKYGSSNPNKLTFAHKPIMVFVQARDYVSNTTDYHLRMVRESVWSNGVDENSRYAQTVSWTDTAVSWYSVNATAGNAQFNDSSTVYCYIAILAADE